MRTWHVVIVLSTCATVLADTIDFEATGGIADDFTLATAWHNGGLLNKTLNALAPGDTLVIPNKTFHLMGGILVQKRLTGCVIQLDGTLDFSDDIDAWPRSGDGPKAPVLECLDFAAGVENVTFTSSGTGLVHGHGSKWWGVPFIGYLEREENRPRLLHFGASKGVLLERWDFINSPYWTVTIDCDGLEIRHCNIDARRDPKTDKHSLIEESAFNTDGFDVFGRNIHIHDCNVWNQDDSFCVKNGVENVLIERVHASGCGLTIGSISSHVRNITFRDIYMHHTIKGIYMKFRGGGLIEDVLYENIVMDAPEQWAIWIGPAQQSDSDDVCAAHPCSICWPDVPFTKCVPPPNALYRNITLRNITINSPALAPGVIMADAKTSPMENVVFDNVVVHNPSAKKAPWGTGYNCIGVSTGTATGTTSPVPSCFKDMTTATLEARQTAAAEQGGGAGLPLPSDATPVLQSA